MSKLFREIQEPKTSFTDDSAPTAALSDRIRVVQTETQATCNAPPPPLVEFQTVDLRPVGRPILLENDADAATHSAFEAYRSLRTKLTRLQASQGVHSVAITSAVAGEGKTVSTLNLAISLAHLKTQRVLLIDGDIRTAGLSELVGIADRPGLGEILRGQCEFANAVVATNIPELYAVGAGEPSKVASDLFAVSSWKEFIGWCTVTFGIVIVDCPPILGLADFDLISAACDGVLLVVRAHKTKRETLVEMGQHLQDYKVLGIILNGQERRGNNYYGYYYYSRDRQRSK